MDPEIEKLRQRAVPGSEVAGLPQYPVEQLVCRKMSDVLEKVYHIDFIDNKLIRR